MDRIDIYLTKIDAINRFNAGEIKLMNEEVALTGLFNSFLRHLLDEWADGEPISPADAPEMAKQVIQHLAFGLREPSREQIETIASGPDAAILPLLTVRWLMRNAAIRVTIPHLGAEWGEFVGRYGHVIAALDPKSFSFARGDR